MSCVALISVILLITFVLFLAKMFPLCDQACSIKLCSCSFFRSRKFDLVSSPITFWPFNLRRAEITLILSVHRSILHIIVLVLLIVPSVFWIRFLFDGNRCDWIQLFSGRSQHYFGFLCWSTFSSGDIISF